MMVISTCRQVDNSLNSNFIILGQSFYLELPNFLCCCRDIYIEKQLLKLWQNILNYSKPTAVIPNSLGGGDSPFVKPNVSHCIEENHVHYNPLTMADRYLTTIARENGTITFEIIGNYDDELGREHGVSSEIFEKAAYSLDNGETWTEMVNSSTTIGHQELTVNVSQGDRVMWKGKGVATLDYDGDWDAYVHFKSSNLVDVEGNINSMILWDDFKDVTDISELAMGTFCAMFCDPNYWVGIGEEIEGNPNHLKIVDASKLSLPNMVLTDSVYEALFASCSELIDIPKLPATTLADGCYSGMFDGCASLTTTPQLPATTLADGCYYAMFGNCTSLTRAPQLPATTLAEYCYSCMFDSCTSLTTAPQLLETTLADDCYEGMFYGCTSLTTAPRLPATTLANYCYRGMFNGCTSLTIAPELPATTLAAQCYGSMFEGCTSLTTAPQLPATTLTSHCYYEMFYGCTSLTTVPQLSATTLADDCCGGMFRGCISLTTVSELLATTLASYCYVGMFENCTNLTTAPTLPATTLVDGCYQAMFADCANLNYIKAMFTTTPSWNYTGNWVDGVAASGTFVKNSAAQWNVMGVNGIPTNWTVETASE